MSGSTDVEKIKQRLDIAEVLGEYIKLRRAGSSFKALCPFHNEKTPSFVVSSNWQSWKCFGCGEGGDMFSFVEKIEGVDFYEALQILARKAGVELKRTTSAQHKQATQKRNALLAACVLAKTYFHKQLSLQSGEVVKQYLNERGISTDSITEFQLGYAPFDSSGLVNFFNQHKCPLQYAQQAGILYQRNSGEWVNRFFGRIMFPITNDQGKVVGFGGRRLTDALLKQLNQPVKDDIAKYINTPTTPMYDKSNVLYGFYKAKQGMRKKDECVLVEGYTDVILAHQHGYDNVVAASGTSLTDGQLRLISRFTKNLAIAFDMDIAGDNATTRGIQLAQSREFSLTVVQLSDNQDPADYIQTDPKQLQDELDRIVDGKYKVEKWEKLGPKLQKAQKMIDFYLDRAFKMHNSTTGHGKKQISAMLMPALKSVANEVEKAHWVQICAQKLGVPEESIRTQMQKTPEQKHWSSPQEEQQQDLKQQPELPPETIRFYAVLALLAQDPSLIDEAHTSMKNISVDNDLLHVLKKCSKISGNSIQKSDIFQCLDETQKKHLKEALVQQEVIDNPNQEPLLSQLHSLLILYKKIVLEQELKNLEVQLMQKQGKDTTQLLEKVKHTNELLHNIGS